MSAQEIVDFSAYRPALLAYARCLAPSAADAEDLTQATLLAAMEHADQLENREDPRPWLFTILRNRFHRGARQREIAVDDGQWEELALGAGWSSMGADPFAQAAATELRRQLQASFLALEAEDREILLLRDIEELSGPETSAMLGLSTAAMKSRLHRARLRLLAELRRVHEVPEAGAGEESFDMTCLEVLQCLPHYADGTLSADAKASVERHVAVCRACAHFGQRYADLLAALPSLLQQA